MEKEVAAGIAAFNNFVQAFVSSLTAASEELPLLSLSLEAAESDEFFDAIEDGLSSYAASRSLLAMQPQLSAGAQDSDEVSWWWLPSVTVVVTVSTARRRLPAWPAAHAFATGFAIGCAVGVVTARNADRMSGILSSAASAVRAAISQ